MLSPVQEPEPSQQVFFEHLYVSVPSEPQQEAPAALTVAVRFSAPVHQDLPEHPVTSRFSKPQPPSSLAAEHSLSFEPQDLSLFMSEQCFSSVAKQQYFSCFTPEQAFFWGSQQAFSSLELPQLFFLVILQPSFFSAALCLH